MAREKQATSIIESPKPPQDVNNFLNIAPMGGFKIPQKIMIVGCGGTGAYVAGHLARLLVVLNADMRRYDNVHLILADGDKVEQKNLERQHFIRKDLGLNKADALAARYSAAFGMEIESVSSYLESPRAVAKFNPEMLIGCVDNNASRRVIHEWFSSMFINSYQSRFWVDAGNEENSGQVVCGFLTPPNDLLNTYDTDGIYDKDIKLFSLPTITEIYPAVLDGESKFNSQLSCAELAEAAPQNMMTNITSASLVLNFVQKILRGKALRAHGVVFSVDNSFRTMLNTPENLAKVNPKRRRSWEKPAV